MEVIVDDSQLSLAIGKKGQNVRLAAKLLGWKIDIKSEEEKRQEVESAMAALVAPGAPVSVLIDYGLAEEMVEKLVEAGVGTVEKLGGMTPEELEEIPGIGPDIGGEDPGRGERLLQPVRAARPKPAAEPASRRSPAEAAEAKPAEPTAEAAAESRSARGEVGRARKQSEAAEAGQRVADRKTQSDAERGI